RWRMLKWPPHFNGQEIGLEWVPPPRPEPSRLNDCFLGNSHDSRPRSSPVPFFPEVHEELTKSWKAPLSARARYTNSSSLTTLEGGPMREYTEVPQVERVVAMHLCPQNAASWRGRPRLPSRACKFSSALVAKAYTASGQAASAPHAMAILQVYQAKVLKDLHEGVPDPELLQELRSVTDYALRATKVTAQALGRAMSTMVVQERHLWLNLAEMRDAEKVRFLDASIPQAGLFGKTVEEVAQQFSTVKKQTEAIKHILPQRVASTCPARPRQQPPPAPHRRRPVLQLDPPNGPALAARPQPTKNPHGQAGEGGSFDLSGSTLDEGMSAGFDSILAVCHPADGHHMVNKRAISFFSGHYSQRFRPSFRWPDAVSSNQNMRSHASCVPPCSETASSEILCLVPTTQTRPAKQPVVFGASYLQPQAVFPATVHLLQVRRVGELFRLAKPGFSGPFGSAMRFISRDAGPSSAAFSTPHPSCGDRKTVPSAKMKKGFYSPYFIVPKKGGGLRPILDLRVLNRALLKLPFKMLTLKHILTCIRDQDWFVAIDLKDAYFHVSTLPRHRPFLRTRFFTFGLSLCYLAALAPLREVGIRILNHLDDWLILAHSRGLILAHRDVVLNHLARFGLRVNWEKSKLSPAQSISFLGVELDSVSMSARLPPEHAHTQMRVNGPTETVSEAPGTHGILSRGYAAGFDAHETATALASYPSPEMGMVLRHVP
ncbi:hypothetical protein M9458_035592, partial [Cirrhinus mrigala]